MKQGRRKGMVIVYVALGMVAFMGVAAMSVDMGMLYKRKAEAQSAADAAALAGAWHLAHSDTAGAAAAVYDYAQQNGYDTAQTGTTVVPTTPWQSTPNWYHVVVRKPQNLMFAGFLGINQSYVAASATAQYLIAVEIPIDPVYYGLKDGPVTFSVFGPDGLHSNGDPYSVNTLNNGSANPDYDGKGYNFTLNVPNNYASVNGTNKVEVGIFDPDCHNNNNYADAGDGTNSGGVPTYDELRGVHSSGAGTAANATTTVYTIVWDKDGNPYNTDPADHVSIAQKSFGDVSVTDGKWNTPAGFTFDGGDKTKYPTGTFRVNVTSTAGSSENGFNLRAGPPQVNAQGNSTLDANGNSTMTDAAWHDKYSGATGTTGAGKNGTSISSQGRLPMNFNTNGTADVLLGNVPSTAAGGHFFITKFDTDVGAQGVYYTCDSLPGQTFNGVLAGNDQTKTDTITLPANYPGGMWHAHYTAAADDTSNWSLGYDKGTGVPGGIRLVQ
ncbi:MAG: hypothetical protein JO316_20240 [Abitibacteriaceae bacterium]|nr:hypothetical protein [Abditibacteriaceae bacterium]